LSRGAKDIANTFLFIRYAPQLATYMIIAFISFATSDKKKPTLKMSSFHALLARMEGKGRRAAC
jgi:hypothetical protein